jgi:molecular chaperone DnaK
LNVSAKDLATQNQQRITISGSGNLSKAEVERMVKEAEANADVDRKMQELAELKNRADALVYSVEKMLKDLGDKVSESDRSRIEEKVTELKGAKEREDEGAMQTAYNELEQESHKLAEEMYKNTAGSAQPEAGPSEEQPAAGAPKADGEEVIDAEFKEEK